MSNQLPDLLDPARAVAQAREYGGCVRVGSLPRLRPLVANARGELRYCLRFARDGAHRAVVHVVVRGVLSLFCQRCLEVMEWPVDEQSALALVRGFDEAAALPDDYDPLILDETLLRPLSLVEDEVLLAIPAIPRHSWCESPEPRVLARPLGDCRSLDARAGETGGEQLDDQAMDAQGARVKGADPDASPFAALADWSADRD